MNKTFLSLFFAFCVTLSSYSYAEEDVYSSKSLDEIKTLVNNNDMKAQFSLGYRHQQGLDGFKHSYKNAIKWYTKAANQGYAPAQYNLALIYQNAGEISYGSGEEINSDGKEYIELYNKAAAQGESGAQFELGRIYLNGKVVKQSYKDAFKWLKEAANNGVGRAALIIAFHYRDGEGLEKSKEKALKWFIKAADLGDYDAKDIMCMSIDRLNVPKEIQDKHCN